MPNDLRVAPPLEQRGFGEALARRGLAPLTRHPVTTLQINVGWRCDLACTHCHVEAGPKRTEMMDRKTADRVLTVKPRQRTSLPDRNHPSEWGQVLKYKFS